ncbi:MAG: hypothetical protein ACI4SF_04115 [Oscillospiraceae bacterium]
MEKLSLNFGDFLLKLKSLQLDTAALAKKPPLFLRADAFSMLNP